MSLLYLALTDGTTTLELTDGLNFSLAPGWLPNIAFDSDQRTVVDSIPINILGATTSGGPSQAGKMRLNYIKLVALLHQIERGQNGDGGIVKLVYTSPGSAPARRIACRVTRWDPATFPVDINAAQNLVTNEINEVVLTLEHRVPWVWQSYLYANLLTNSAWSTTPTPTAILGTAAYVASTGAYGGAGLIRLTHTTPGSSSIYPATLLAVTNGVPVTVTFTASWTSGITSILFVLIDSGSVTFRSSSVTNAVSGATAMTAGQRFTATVTPTITGNTRLFWQMVGPNAAITEIAEVFVHATAEETWHLDTALEGLGTPAPTVAAHPINTLITIPRSPALADTELIASGFAAGATVYGPLLTILAPAASVLLNYPNAAAAGMFTNPADAARLSLGGTIMRFTPVVASTYYGEPTAATTMLDAIGVGTSTSLLRRLVIIPVLVNNSATATFSIYVRGYIGGGRYIDSRPVDIPPNGADPRHLIMPEIYNADGFFDIKLFFSSSIAGQTLDVDRVYCIGVNEETSIKLSESNYDLTTGSGSVIFDPATLTAPLPSMMSSVTPSGTNPATVRMRTADNPLFRTRSESVRLIVDGVSDGVWQAWNGAAVTLLTATVNRKPAFDAPL